MKLAIAKLAGDFRTNVLGSNPQFFVAVRTIQIAGCHFDAPIINHQAKLSAAEFARDRMTNVFAADSQFVLAVRTKHMEAFDFHINHAGSLLQFNSRRSVLQRQPTGGRLDSIPGGHLKRERPWMPREHKKLPEIFRFQTWHKDPN